jgi:hypothetical protein
MGGSEQTTPAQARVMMLGFPSESTQVTRTTGQGNKAVQGLFLTFMNHDIFRIVFNFYEPSISMCNKLEKHFSALPNILSERSIPIIQPTKKHAINA